MLIDRFGRKHTYLRISVTDRCNLRCQYCMPQEGIEWKPREEILTFEEIERVARVFVELGITKIRLTGGEPLVRKNLVRLVEALASMPGLETLAMTTNGVLLKDKAHALRQAGLTALNVSLDSLRRERFELIAKRDDHANVMAGIYSALECGFDPLKLNVVVMAGVNDDEILDFVEFVRDKPINVRFIEYMPFKDNEWKVSRVFSYGEMKGAIERRYRLEPLAAGPGAVAKDFAVGGFLGSVSFITSMTDSFCASCNRLRLTADGSIKSCLFYPAEVFIREEIRAGITDDSLAALIRSAVLLKPPEHPPMEEILASENRAMIEIGG
ncbi:MAG TPA: GTP 3',8-cyclase MoaA [Candidatus Obscuribacterales bacterium]